MSDKSVMGLIEEIYRNYNLSIGECVEDMHINGRITVDDLRKDRSLKKLDWMSVEQQTSSTEIREIAQKKIYNMSGL